MSTATDLADFETACVEAELSDEEREAVKETIEAGATLEEAVAFVVLQRDEGGDDDVSATGPPAELGEPTSQQLKALEKETDRHLAKVRDIMGAHVAGFADCDACGGIGLTPPGPRPRDHEFFKTCDTCSGYGQVKTGSLRQGNEARDCPACRGRGYLEALDANGAPLAEAQATAPAPVAVQPQAVDGVVPPPPPAPAQTEPRFGVPSWMGDPSIGR